MRAIIHEKSSLLTHANGKLFSQLAIIFIIIFAVIIFVLPCDIKPACVGCDFSYAFRPAVQNVLAGNSPYTGDFFSPPWVLVLLAPFALLPMPIGLAAYWIAGTVSLYYAARKLGASKTLAFALICSPQILLSLFGGNNDWMVALGFVLPPQIGLFFVLAKPQLGFPIAVFWLVEAFRENGVKEVFHQFLPIGLACLVSILIFREELFHIGDAAEKWWNISAFPYTIPFGLVLLWKSINNRNPRLSMLAGPTFAPYITTTGLPIIAFGLLPSEIETLLAIAGFWIIWIANGPV